MICDLAVLACFKQPPYSPNTMIHGHNQAGRGKALQEESWLGLREREEIFGIAKMPFRSEHAECADVALSRVLGCGNRVDSPRPPRARIQAHPRSVLDARGT
jgi:hypothetical protein